MIDAAADRFLQKPQYERQDAILEWARDRIRENASGSGRDDVLASFLAEQAGLWLALVLKADAERDQMAIGSPEWASISKDIDALMTLHRDVVFLADVWHSTRTISIDKE